MSFGPMGNHDIVMPSLVVLKFSITWVCAISSHFDVVFYLTNCNFVNHSITEDKQVNYHQCIKLVQKETPGQYKVIKKTRVLKFVFSCWCSES